MIRKFLIISIIIITGIILYFFNIKKDTNSIWDLVPSKSIIILELDDPFKRWTILKEKINDSPFHKLLRSHEDIINNTDIFLDENLEIFSKNNKLIISYIQISKKDLEPIYIAYKKNLNFDFLSDKLKELEYKKNQRNFNDQIIHEFNKNDKKKIFLILDDFIIFSERAILIEDVIRSLNNYNIQYKNLNSQLYNQIQLKDDLGNLYINIKSIYNFIKGDIPSKIIDKSFNFLDKNLFFDISYDNNVLNLSGFSSPQNNRLVDESLEDDSMIETLPNNTIFYTQKNTSNLTNFSIINNLKDSIPSKFFDFFYYEIGSFISDNSFSNTLEEIIILKEKKKYKITFEDSLNYKEESIFIIDDSLINNFFSKTIISNKAYKYLYKQNEYLFFSSNISSLKGYIDKVVKKEYWNREIQFNRFYNKLNKNQNFTIITDLEKLSRYLKFKYLDYYKNLGVLSIQTKIVNDKYFTSINHQEKILRDINNSNSKKILFNASSDFIMKPNIIFSHVDNTPEVISQDNFNRIYHLSNNLKKIWSDSIESKINSKIYTIDYYKNNKKQIIFSTENKIHSYDRKGNKLIGFPIEDPSINKISHLNIIDYDQSKRYRIVVANEFGEIFFMDKSGRKLRGWNPMKMNDELVQEPFHYRIKGKDYILILLKNGEVHLKNRRGENYSGFPLKIDGSINNRSFTKITTSTKSSYIQLISEYGIIYKISFEGKIISKSEMLRETKNSKFYMLLDAFNQNPEFITVDENKINKNNNSIEFSRTDEINFQNYNFGNNKKFIVLNDKNSNKSYFLSYDLDTYFPPIENENDISILYSKGSFKLYSTFKNTLAMIELKK